MIKVFESFAGVGTQAMALKRIGIDYEVVGISEIDKFALKSYEEIHGKVNNFGDISKINPNNLPDFDLFTYSFPCKIYQWLANKLDLIRIAVQEVLFFGNVKE